MQESDVFFTRTIVGSPFSALLGRRLGPADARVAALKVDLRRGGGWLAQAYDDRIGLIRSDATPDGRPHRRPGRWRRRLERHALALAIAGLVMLALGGAMLGLAARGSLPWT